MGEDFLSRRGPPLVLPRRRNSKLVGILGPMATTGGRADGGGWCCRPGRGFPEGHSHWKLSDKINRSLSWMPAS